MLKIVAQWKNEIAGVTALAAGSAMAAVPADVTTALTEAKTDGVTIAGAVLVAIVAIFSFRLMRKSL